MPSDDQDRVRDLTDSIGFAMLVTHDGDGNRDWRTSRLRDRRKVRL